MKLKYHYDSRKIVPGDTYICLPKGEAYVDDAYKNGAIDVIHMTRKEMGKFSDKLFGHPSKQLCVIGVTGTNGKTTIVHALGQALKKLGYNPFVLGTLNSNLTTPESFDTQQLMANHLEQGGTHFIMEVSSHGIAQHRIEGIHFSVKVLSNITQDHLDFHGSFEAYKKTKLSFINSPIGKSIHPRDYQQITVPDGHVFKGEFNHANLQAVKAVLVQLSVPEQEINRVILYLSPPPGRFEFINEDQPFDVIVDYAHTPDGLENVLIAAKSLLKTPDSQLTCVFGCGGDRDKDKRPKMGAVAQQLADRVILTQDNPRTESSDQIFNDILLGLDPNKDIEIIKDRKNAIFTACKNAKPNDIVLIAGKGHETVQIIGNESFHFSDSEVAKEAIKSCRESIH